MGVTTSETTNDQSPQFPKSQASAAENTGTDKPKPAKTVRLMERLHAAEAFSTPQQSKIFLDSLSYDDFKKWISFVNGVELGIQRSERAQVSDSHLQSEAAFLGTEVEYRPPHKDYRDRLLKMALEKAQSINDPEIAALTLGLSINAIHYFADGNGRTARIVYALLTRGYNGSQEDQAFYSSLLENTKGREVLNPNPVVSGIDKKIRSERFAEMQAKSGFSEAFGDNLPTYVFDGYAYTFVGERSPDKIAAGDKIDATGRAMLHRIMESGGLRMTSLMATFGPDRIKDYVHTSPDGKRTFVDGNQFLPSLTQEEITQWWNNSELEIVRYVLRIIDVADRDDVAEIAACYKPQTNETPITSAPQSDAGLSAQGGGV